MVKGFTNEDFDVGNDLTVANDANVTGAVAGGAGSSLTDSTITNFGAFVPAVQSALTADVNDYAISTATLNMISTDGGEYNVTGIVAGAPGQLCMVCHTGGAKITFQEENASSSAENRIITGAGDLEVVPNQSIILVYDDSATRWRMFKNA